MDLKVSRRYRLLSKLGSGGFGDIYRGVDIKSGNEVAIKLEVADSTMPQLEYEYQIYKQLEGGASVGIPQVYHFTKEGDFNIMVMDIMGPSLESLFQFCEKKFTEETVAKIAIQCLERIKYLHSKGFIHRDIKPENLLIGKGPRMEDTINLIDFGLTKRYKDPKTGHHISLKVNRGPVGTLRFCSLFAS